MKTFKQFINEETMPYANVKSGEMDVGNSAVRDQINQLLAGVTDNKFVTPYIAIERVAKVLANFHIYIPSQHFLEGESGTMVWPVQQYGNKVGMNDMGQFVVDGSVKKDETHGPHMGGEGSYEANSPQSNQYSIYFEYRQGDCGMFYIFCEIVTQDELEEIMDDLEAELNDEGEEETMSEETVNEVSDTKLSRYIKAAKKDRDENLGDMDKMQKRGEGMKMARAKLYKVAKVPGVSPMDQAERDLKKAFPPKSIKQRVKEESGYYYGKQKVTELKLSDEQQMEERDPVAPETGPRKTPGSNQQMSVLAKVLKKK
jgi:hypothetical protein